MPRLYSHPVVHPHPVVVAAPPAQWQVQGQQAAAPVQGEGENGDGNAPPGVIMRNRGKRCRPGMRLAQAAFAAAALAAMAPTHGFASVTAFRYLIVAATVQCLWSLAVAIVDLYALLAKRTFRNARAFSILALGDWVTGAMIFSASCGSAGITVLLDNDLRACPGNHCPSFMTATAMAFLCWFVCVPSGIISLWWAVYKIQRS
ncbi:hypothetical protein ACQJBY_019428 [Aegilops geniculata]